MSSIAALIGLDRSDIPRSALSSFSAANVDPQDYPRFASDAKQLGQDIRTAYSDALREKYDQDRLQDRHFLERAKDFVELKDQVDTSSQLLTELASFLSTFQTDLSAVSGHISELQTRSKTIEGRLEARKAVERSLQPFLEAITISPALIRSILDTPVSPSWIPAVVELDQKLGAVRGGARVETRRQLDQVAEALRLAATTKISDHLNSLLRPYTTSLSPLAPLHKALVNYKPLFDFLRRHSARQAHEFQKNYTSTIRWYHETAFRRYVRSLEGLRTRTSGAAGTGFKWDELVSTGNESQASLALLNAQRRGAGGTPQIPHRAEGLSISESSRSAITHSRLGADPNSEESGDYGDEDHEKVPVIPAWRTNDKTLKPTYEQLFRSISIVLAHNSSECYRFVDAFFGVHSSLPSPFGPAPTTNHDRPPGAGLPGRMRRLDSNGSISAISSATPHQTLPAVGESDGDDRSESGKTVTSQYNGRDQNHRSVEDQEKMRKSLVEGLWKSVMEPALEYSINFVHALLTPPSSPSPLSLVSMIRLNNALLSATADTQPPALLPCPPLEGHLYSIRLLLWPLFTKTLDSQIESLKKINGHQTPAGSSGGVGGLLGRMAATGGHQGVKDSTVHAILERYVEWFLTTVEMCSNRRRDLRGGVELRQRQSAEPDQDDPEDEPIFQHLLRLRGELDRLLVHQSSKIEEPVKRKAFLRAGYDELVRGLTLGLTRDRRVQQEIAHYRELARTVQ
ncbi:hypothetical protein JCM3766R1_005734 [Sporobolomyces carnicolor]